MENRAISSISQCSGLTLFIRCATQRPDASFGAVVLLVSSITLAPPVITDLGSRQSHSVARLVEKEFGGVLYSPIA